MKRSALFEEVSLGQVFYVAGGEVRSLVKISDKKASPTWPTEGPAGGLSFDANSHVFVDADSNECDDAFLESAVRNSSMRFDFSRALYLLKTRDCVLTRAGWELLGQPTVFLSPGRAVFEPEDAPPVSLMSIPSHLYRNTPERPEVIVPGLCMKYRDGKINAGWTPNTLDLMAEDWYVPHLPRKGYAMQVDL